MKKICLIFLLSTISFSIYCQDTKIVQETIYFINETYNIPESNPIHFEESNLIDSIFNEVLFDYFEITKSANNISSEFLFSLLSRNSSSDYDDSPDVRRMKMRRSKCFSAIAIKMKDFSSSQTFFEYAEYSILYNCPNEIETLLETNFCGLLFTELLFSFKNNKKSFESVLQRIENFLADHVTDIDKEIIDRASTLIVEYKKLKKN